MIFILSPMACAKLGGCDSSWDVLPPKDLGFCPCLPCLVVLLLGHDDTHATMEASEQNQAVSDITTKASRREQVASDHDQNEIISSPEARDQNHENVCVVGVTGDQNNEEARDGSEDQDQNCEQNYGKNGHSKRTNEKTTKTNQRDE